MNGEPHGAQVISVGTEKDIFPLVDEAMKADKHISLNTLYKVVKNKRGTACQIVVSRRYNYNRRRMRK